MSQQARDELEVSRKKMFKKNQAGLPEIDRACTKVPCFKKDGKYKCTKEKGHEGDHCSHGRLGFVHHRWPLVNPKLYEKGHALRPHFYEE